MKAIFLCAGKGTRMLPFTKILPKEMLPLGNRPLLHHTLQHFYDNGIHDFSFILGEGKSSIKDYFTYQVNEFQNAGIEELNNLIKNSKIEFLSDQHKGTGGSLLCAKKSISDDYFFVIFGDIYISSDHIKNMLNIHKQSGNSIILVTTVNSSYRMKYKQTILGEDNKIISLLSDVDKDSDEPMNMVGGAFILHKDVFTEIQNTITNDLNKEYGLIRPLENMLLNHTLYGYQSQSGIYDIGNIEDRKKAFIIL